MSKRFDKCSYLGPSSLLIVALCLLGGRLVARESPPVARAAHRSFSRAERERVDHAALWSPREHLPRDRVETYGNVLQWLVARTPLPTDEERRRAVANQEKLLAKVVTSQPPQQVQELFTKLVLNLPPRMRPEDYRFTLIAVKDLGGDAFTVGAGYVFIDQAAMDSLLADRRSGLEQMAFIIAHELGHICRGHARREYQQQWLEEEIENESSGNPTAREIVDGVGAVLRNAYTPEQDFQADLFAIHLCRNAGFELENCLDALRGEAVRDDPRLLEPQLPKSGQPPVEPETASTTADETTADETTAEHRQPSAAHRLRRLRLEVDGQYYQDAYGLFAFDRQTQAWKPAADAAVDGGTRAIVFIHGMESDLSVYLPQLQTLVGEPAAEGIQLLGFRYPADSSLSRAGGYLQRELQRVCRDPRQADFVCHSAGGLVFRYYAEVLGGEFRRAFFEATPHAGSDLASLRSLLEAKQFFGNLRLGYAPDLQNAIVEGRGQITFDLQPGSLFLTYLNRPRDDRQQLRDRYTIFRGQALRPGSVFLFNTLLAAARQSTTGALRRKYPQEDTVWAKFARAGIDMLSLPAEVAKGDLAVTVDSAALEGVPRVTTFRLGHVALPRDPQVIAEVNRQLLDPPQP